MLRLMLLADPTWISALVSAWTSIPMEYTERPRREAQKEGSVRVLSTGGPRATHGRRTAEHDLSMAMQALNVGTYLPRLLLLLLVMGA